MSHKHFRSSHKGKHYFPFLGQKNTAVRKESDFLSAPQHKTADMALPSWRWAHRASARAGIAVERTEAVGQGEYDVTAECVVACL